MDAGRLHDAHVRRPHHRPTEIGLQCLPKSLSPPPRSSRASARRLSAGTGFRCQARVLSINNECTKTNVRCKGCSRHVPN
jgi:hypothetical protein